MSKRINISENMRLIRKAMIDLDLNNLADLAAFLYVSESQFRQQLNGHRKIRIADVEYMENKLNIKFDWTDIKKIDTKYCMFYDNSYINDD